MSDQLLSDLMLAKCWLIGLNHMGLCWIYDSV